MTIRRVLILIPHLMRMGVRSKLEYRGATIAAWFAQALSYGGQYAAIALILMRFGNLGGWTWSEMALLLAFHLLAYAIGASLSFAQFREIEERVRLGSFDALLVKPVGPWVYLAFSGINIGFLGHAVLGVALMAWALTQVADWTIAGIAYLFATLIGAAMLVAAIMTMIGATALVWVRSNHLFAVFFGFWELARYPLAIFPWPLQFIMVTAMPLGFMAYVPVAVSLGKEVALLGDWAGLLSLLAGPTAVLLARLHWKYCVKNYQSAGG